MSIPRPSFVRSFTTDFLETVIPLFLALNLSFPGSLDEAKAAGLLFLAAAGAAFMSALRRAYPAIKAWALAIIEDKLFPVNLDEVDLDSVPEAYDVETNLDGDITIINP